ncbi:hypothetical protein O6H91_Y395200 [Diphasiastrum complanatum]|nr:hypothetical protein O6H91_Y395200 [Diphasiastrum complanatum]
MAMCSVSVTRPSSSSIALPSSSFSSSSLFLQRPSHAVVAIPLKQLRNSRLASTHKKPGSRLECVAAAAAFEEGRRSTDYFDEGPQETEEEITKAYEALYGPKFGGLSKDRRWDSSTDGGDEDGAGKAGKGRRGRGGSDDGMGRPSRRGAKDNLEERVVQIRRVTKVVKGGKQLSFRAIVVVGDKKGRVGVGVGKAKEVVAAVQKSGVDARRHMANVPMTKYRTFPHRLA